MLGWAAFALACSVFVLPVVNPDIYWHLSAGKYTVAHLAPPRADFLSWPLYGREWVDFEWLPQVIYYLLHLAGGFRALQVFKALLLAGVLLTFRSTLLLYGRRSALPLLLPFFALGLMSNCDLRPENFTLLFFALTLLALEKSRLGGRPPGLPATAAFFAFWANLHAGFAYGLALIGLYAAGEAFSEQLPYVYGSGPLARPGRSLAYLKALGAGLAASLANPYGWKIFPVMLDHQRHMAELQAHMQEWGRVTFSTPYQWPFALVLAGAFGSAAYFLLKRRHVVYQHVAVLMFFSLAASGHARHIPFFIMTACVFTAALPWKEAGSRARRVPAAAAALLLAGMAWFFPAKVWSNYSSEPRIHKWRSEGLAHFLKTNKAELAGLKLFNNWGWGGWIGWELGPDYRPFVDGRYLFHDRIGDMAGLQLDARSWDRLAGRYGFDLALLPNDSPLVPVRQVVPGAGERVLWRPAYLFYMPNRDWAVVYWDRDIIALARRGAVPAGWLAEHEFRWLRPGDILNVTLPLIGGKLPLSVLKGEAERYEKYCGGRGPAPYSAARLMRNLEELCSRKGVKCAR